MKYKIRTRKRLIKETTSLNEKERYVDDSQTLYHRYGMPTVVSTAAISISILVLISVIVLGCYVTK